MKYAIALAAVLTSTHVAAYEYDQKWIGRTLCEQRCAKHMRRAERVDYHYHGERYSRRYTNRYAYERAQPASTVMIHGVPRLERDALSNVECMPAVTALSREHSSEDTAWQDAQSAWENAVRWRYGERFANVVNSDSSTREKKCAPSRSPQSIAGQLTESIRGTPMQRCEIVARPCMAPTQRNPQVR